MARFGRFLRPITRNIEFAAKKRGIELLGTRAILVVAGIMLMTSLTANADITYNEAIDGEFSADNMDPTRLVLCDGINSIIGSTTFDPIVDEDFFAVTIPDNCTLDAIIMSVYDTTENRSFFAVSEGFSIETDGSDLFGSALVGEANGAMEGDDVLDDLGLASEGGTGFTPPLGAGDYTFWFRENVADVNYQLDFVVTSSVPEPSSMLLMVGAMGAVGIRRRR